MHDLYTTSTVRYIPRLNKPKHNNACTNCHPASRSRIPRAHNSQTRPMRAVKFQNSRKGTVWVIKIEGPMRFRVITYDMGQYTVQRSIPIHVSKYFSLNHDDLGVFLNTTNPFAAMSASLNAPLRLLQDHAPGGITWQRLGYIRTPPLCSPYIRARSGPQQSTIHFRRNSRSRGNSKTPPPVLRPKGAPELICVLGVLFPGEGALFVHAWSRIMTASQSHASKLSAMRCTESEEEAWVISCDWVCSGWEVYGADMAIVC